jgi:hypothetical protein
MRDQVVSSLRRRLRDAILRNFSSATMRGMLSTSGAGGSQFTSMRYKSDIFMRPTRRLAVIDKRLSLVSQRISKGHAVQSVPM